MKSIAMPQSNNNGSQSVIQNVDTKYLTQLNLKNKNSNNNDHSQVILPYHVITYNPSTWFKFTPTIMSKIH